MKKSVYAKIFIAMLSLVSLQAAGDYSKHPDAVKMVDRLVKEDHLDRAYVMHALKAASKQQKILDAISRPAEKVLTWKQYRPIFITQARINKGVTFWQKHQKTLETVEKQYGVPASIIVAIIGVETQYGQYRGRFRVLDALSTLSFDYPPRAAFFRKELKQFLLLCQEHHVDPISLTGSYAGAMGYGQFMPSSFRAYAVDYENNNDNKSHLLDVDDAIASVANYFKLHHWHAGEPIAVLTDINGEQAKKGVRSTLSKPKQRLDDLIQLGWKPKQPIKYYGAVRGLALQGLQGTQYWISFHNFYVITRYNRSDLYAMVVMQLADAIAQQKLSQTASRKNPV